MMYGGSAAEAAAAHAQAQRADGKGSVRFETVDSSTGKKKVLVSYGAARTETIDLTSDIADGND